MSEIESPKKPKAKRRSISIPKLVKVMDDHLIALELGDEITVGEFITALKDVWFSEQSIR